MNFDEQEPDGLIERAQDVLVLLFFLVVPSIVACGLLAFVFGLYWATR